jgi:hypothetical protein
MTEEKKYKTKATIKKMSCQFSGGAPLMNASPLMLASLGLGPLASSIVHNKFTKNNRENR